MCSPDNTMRLYVTYGVTFPPCTHRVMSSASGLPKKPPTSAPEYGRPVRPSVSSMGTDTCGRRAGGGTRVPSYTLQAMHS